MTENTLMTMIQLRESNLHVGSYIIPLHGRKRMMHLIRTMIENDAGVTRNDLRKAIYTQNPGKELSFRLRDSQDCSLSKLISRSRRYLKLALADTPWGRSIDWFVYNGQKKCWRLHDLRPIGTRIEKMEDPNLLLPSNAESRPEDVPGQALHHHVKIMK